MPRKTQAEIAREHVPDPRFADFWQAYPRKTNRLKASIAFSRVNPDPEEFSDIMAAVYRQQATGCLRERYAADGGSVIPHASTWLNNRRWEDEDEPAATPQPRRDRQSDYAASTLLSALGSNGVGHAQPPAPRQLPHAGAGDPGGG